jgi:hypothetical protein
MDDDLSIWDAFLFFSLSLFLFLCRLLFVYTPFARVMTNFCLRHNIIVSTYIILQARRVVELY